MTYTGNACTTAMFIHDGMSVVDLPDLLRAHEEHGGYIELMQAVTQYAEFSEQLLRAMPDQDFPGVYDYEVSEDFGAWFARYVVDNQNLPAQKDAEDEMIRLAAEFFTQGEGELARSEWVARASAWRDAGRHAMTAEDVASLLIRSAGEITVRNGVAWIPGRGSVDLAAATGAAPKYRSADDVGGSLSMLRQTIRVADERIVALSPEGYVAPERWELSRALNVLDSQRDALAALNSLRELTLEMGHTVRALDEDNAHYEHWTNDGNYVPDDRFRRAEELLVRECVLKNVSEASEDDRVRANMTPDRPRG